MRNLVAWLTLLLSVFVGRGVGQQLPAPAPAVGEIQYQPADAVRLAAADLERLPLEIRHTVRYLSLYNIEPAQRADYIKCLSFVVNSLSNTSRIEPLYVVPGTDNTLLRLSLLHYGWKSESWDKLAEQDYVFAPKVVKVVDTGEKKYETRRVKKTRRVLIPRHGGYYAEDQAYFIEERVAIGNKTTERITQGVGLGINPIHVATLLLHTKAKATAVLRGDWFIVKATVPPAYYDFLQLGEKESDFQKKLALTQETIDILRKQLIKEARAGVVRSGVTRNNRRLTRIPSPLGYYWFSSDYLANVDQSNVVRILLTDEPDASEQIGTAANGLQIYFITNKDRKRVDEADINVAVDTNFPDHKVINGRSCIVCHSTGILSFSSDTQQRVRDDISVQTFTPEIKQLLLTYYGEDLKELFDRDQLLYTIAVKKTNGLTPEANAALLRKLWVGYSETDLDIDDIVNELGYSKNVVVAALKKSTDPVLLGLIKKKPLPVRREHWEEVFQLAMGIMIQVRPGRDDPIDKSSFHQRNDTGAAQARRGESPRHGESDGDL